MKYILGFILLVMASYPSLAVEMSDPEALSLEELLQIEIPAKASIGSRGGERSAFNAVVPIDVITANQLASVGQLELARALAALVPGFNYPRPSIADGTDHLPPFSLRTLNPDQILVLINGKRLHQSSLLNINGTMGRGTSSVDLNSIPLQAVERVEILRDGAAAQYGSDAIAGIINIVLKGYGFNNQLSATVGQTHKGDGLVKQTDIFYSHPLANDGFVNLSVEFKDRHATNRAGPDSLENHEVTMRFGDTKSQDGLLAINAESPVQDTHFYLHGFVNHRESSAAAMYRYADDSRNVPEIYPDGFLPKIEPKIKNHLLTAGVKGAFEEGTQWDLSYTYGEHDFHFYVDNSLNRSLGINSPQSFDSGSTSYAQHVVNFDLIKHWQRWMVSAGYEFRDEAYRIKQGDAASYIAGQESLEPGAQGFPGFSHVNAIRASRTSHAGYLDAKYALTPKFSFDAALRGEKYDDFGSSLSGKLATRWRLAEPLLLRASISSGFRAPSLSQANYSYTAIMRNGEHLSRFRVFNVNNPIAKTLGAETLKAEKSIHYTAGFVVQPLDDLSLSADYFITDINNRILPTNYISAESETLNLNAKTQLQSQNIDYAMYFTNAIETRTQGVEARAQWEQEFKHGGKYKLGSGYQFAHTNIKSINATPPSLGVTAHDWVMDPFSKALEYGQPHHSFKAWSNYNYQKLNWTLNLSRYGSFKGDAGERLVKFSARWVADTQFAYQWLENFSLTLGVNNIFNAMPGKWGPTTDTQMGTGKTFEYSQFAPFGYNGTEYYLGVQLQF